MKSRFILILLFSAGIINAIGQELSNDDILKSLRSSFALTEYDHPDHILRFNKDTFLIAGYLSSGITTDVVYQSFDGGKTWKRIHFKGDAWIYNAYFQNDGQVWMGLINQNDHIYYSKLFPIVWKTFNIPVSDFSVDKRTNTIKLTSLYNKSYILNAKLDLLHTITDLDDDTIQVALNNDKVNATSFLASGIKKVQIKAGRYEFDGMSDGCIRFPLYVENVKSLTVKDAKHLSALKNILTSLDTIRTPASRLFTFSKEDLDDYQIYYDSLKAKSMQEKTWGGDFSYFLNLDNDLFLHPEKTVDRPSQKLLDKAYTIYALSPYAVADNASSIAVNIINNRSDTLKIKSKNPSLYSLPWTIEYKKLRFDTFDTRITNLLKTILPIGFNYYDRLLAGELIFHLIEQRVINEMEYRKGN